MEAFEAELAKATNGDLLGAVAMVIDNSGKKEVSLYEATRKRASN